MQIGEYYSFLTQTISKVYDQREAENISGWLMENALDQKPWKLRGNIAPLQPDLEAKLEDYRKQVLTYKPVQYILHEAWFYKRKFFVAEGVLIPRPETEELVQFILEFIKKNPLRNLRVLDIGTGSGCIPISLQLEAPQISCVAIDVSRQALEIASKNALDHDVKIMFRYFDILDENSWSQLRKFDIIVSNPPYIPLSEKQSLAKNVSAHEPGLSLFVDAGNPLLFYQKIALFSKKHLAHNGGMFLEIHENFGTPVKELLIGLNFSPVIKKDLFGKDRFAIHH